MKAELVDAQTASSIIATKDDYISNFSEFDLQSRLETSENVSKEDLMEFLSQQTVDWTNSEEIIVNSIFSELDICYGLYKEIRLFININIVLDTLIFFESIKII